MSFSRFLTIVRAHLSLILAFGIIAAVAAGIVTLAMPKRYIATASVVVDPNVAQAAAGSYASGRPDEFMSTHLDLIANPAVANHVSEALKLGDRPDIGVLLSGSSVVHKARQFISMLVDFGDDDGPAADPKDWIADQLLRNLSVKTNRDSRLMRIAYAAPDPEFAATVANAFARSYLDTLRNLQVGPAKEQAASYEGPLKNLQKELETAETRLAKFQQEKGILATDERMDIETARLGDLSSQVVLAQSMSYESQARQQQLQGFLSRGGGEAPAEVMISPVVQQLKQSVSDREAKLAELSRRIGPNHPQYSAATTELDGLKQQLNEQMRSAARGLLASGGVAGEREGSLRGALDAQRGKVLKLKSDRNQLAILTREMESARAAYEAALQRVTQTRTASHAGQTSGTIVNPAAAPLRPASPRPSLNVAIALIAGLVVGIGLALYRESIEEFIRSERDVTEILGTPVLAILLPRSRKYAPRVLPGPNVHSLPNQTL